MLYVFFLCFLTVLNFSKPNVNCFICFFPTFIYIINTTLHNVNHILQVLVSPTLPWPSMLSCSSWREEQVLAILPPSSVLLSSGRRHLEVWEIDIKFKQLKLPSVYYFLSLLPIYAKCFPHFNAMLLKKLPICPCCPLYNPILPQIRPMLPLV